MKKGCIPNVSLVGHIPNSKRPGKSRSRCHDGLIFPYESVQN
jgi:hypothetical protein